MMFSRRLRLPRAGSCFLFGPRQTGKSTLVRGSVPEKTWTADLLQQDGAPLYTKHPALLRESALKAIRAGAHVVFVNEVQRVPRLLDEVHGLIELTKARFVLTGSSARKLRTGVAPISSRGVRRSAGCIP